MSSVRSLTQRTPLAVAEGRGALKPLDLVCLGLLLFLWSLCFPLLAWAASKAPALYVAALRSLLAGTALLVPACALRRPPPRDRATWFGVAGAGLGYTALGFGGMALGGGSVSPGLATVLTNVQPLVAAVLAYLVLGERLGRRTRVALSIGFAGVVVIALPGLRGESANSDAMGILYVLLGALGVAVGNVLLKRLAGRVDLLTASGWQLLLGGLPLLLAAALLEPARITLDSGFWIVLLALGLLGTAVPTALWFFVLHRGQLSRLNSFTFLTPAFALVIGALLFGERPLPLEMAGIVVSLLAVLLVSRGNGRDTGRGKGPRTRARTDDRDNESPA